MATSGTATNMATTTVPFGKELREKEFLFDGKYVNLNHGSFGTHPRAIQKALRSFQDQAEARPDHFIRYQYPKLLDQSREAIGKIVNAPTETLVFIPNATTGINTVLRNLIFEPGDHILYLSCIYGSCEKTVSYMTETTPVEAVKIDITFPVEDDWLVDAFANKINEVESQGGKVKIAIFDTVVSLPGVRLPFERLVELCRQRGVYSCVDGAHGVGHIPLNLETLDPDFLVSNCHKWLHVPRGCALMYVPLRNQPLIRSTLPTSHGFEPIPKPGVKIISPFRPVVGKSKWIYNFEFVGTIDNSPYLCVPAALKWREEHGGENAIMDYCIMIAKEAGRHYAKVLGTEVLDNAAGSLSNCPLTNIRLPLSVLEIEALGVKGGIKKEEVGGAVRDWMVEMMIVEHDTFMAMIFHGGAWWIRLSGQVYLEFKDFEWGAQVLKGLCERVKKGDFLNAKSRL